MKTKLLLVGAGGFGRVTLEYASRQFDCVFVDDGQAVGTVVDGVEVVGGISDLQRLHDEAGFDQLIVTIGKTSCAKTFIAKLKRLAIAFPTLSAAALISVHMPK